MSVITWEKTWNDLQSDYERKHPRSRALDEKARSVLPGGDTRSSAYFNPFPFYVQRAEGYRLHDVDGNSYIDFLNNYGSLILGHCHPVVLQAVNEHIQRGQAFAAGIEKQIELAGELCGRLPAVDRVRFCNSGTEANMFAMRAAKAYTGREKLIKMEGGYHGSHDQAEISVKPPLDRAGPASSPASVPEFPGISLALLDEILVVPFNDLDALEKTLQKHHRELAGVIVEPFLGACGCIPCRPGYLHGVRELCNRYDVLLIFDGVQSLRLARGGAQEYYGVMPDITALGKIIGGGFPVGAFGGRKDIMEIFSPRASNPVSHGGTFNGNLITMAAGLVTLQQLTGDQYRRINDLGDRLRRGLQEALNGKGITGHVTGVGSIANIHLVEKEPLDYRGVAVANKKVIEALHLSLVNRGIFLAKRLYFNISTPMSEQEVNTATETFAEVLEELKPVIRLEFPELLAR